jgi:hypothetical protein
MPSYEIRKLRFLVAAGIAALPAVASAEVFIARLSGNEEVPSIATPAAGQFVLNFNPATNTATYSLAYANLVGNVVQSHIHVGQPGVNGGIAIWLCGTPGTAGPVGTPTCSGTVTGNATGTIDAAKVVGPVGQLVNATELADVVRMLRTGSAYVNVHTTAVPGGEIRGLIR